MCNNSYSTKDYNKDWSAGRLAEWDGKVWKIIEEKSYTEVWSSSHFGAPILATGCNECIFSEYKGMEEVSFAKIQ